AFEAQVDRHIENNDGTTIVELRHFRDVRSVKVDSRLEDLRIDLGAAGNLLFGALKNLGSVWRQPEAEQGATFIRRVDGASLGGALTALRWAGVSPEKISGLDARAAKMVTQVNGLSGKEVRLTYVDGKGVVKVEAVKGAITPDERDF